MTCWTCQQQVVRRFTVQFTTPTTTHQWLTVKLYLSQPAASTRDYDKKGERNSVRSVKSEAERALITVWTVVQTVLTATFNSYGNRQISPPPENRYRWTDQQKSRHSWLCPREDPLYQIWYKSTHWVLLGKWVKYNKKIFFIYTLFLRFAYRSDPWMDFYVRQLKSLFNGHLTYCCHNIIIIRSCSRR